MPKTAVYRLALLLGASLLAFAGSCRNGQQSSQRAEYKPIGIEDQAHCFEVTLKLTSARPADSAGNLARLGYKLRGSDGSEASMSLVDPKQAKAGELPTDIFKVRVVPHVDDPYITSENDRECDVGCPYEFELLTPSNEAIARFAIQDSGNLTIVADTVCKPFDVQLLSTKKRSLYMVFRVSPNSNYAEPIGAFEYKRDPVGSHFNVKASDGWTYAFNSPDGCIGLFHADCLGTLPENLQLVSLSEQQDRTSELRAWAKKVREGRCGGGG
jgi:hypothetical protein